MMKDLPSKCDGFGAKFSARHALSCKNGGLVLGRYNKVKDKLAYLATPATNLGIIFDKSLIQISHNKSKDDMPEQSNEKKSSMTPSPFSKNDDKYFKH